MPAESVPSSGAKALRDEELHDVYVRFDSAVTPLEASDAWKVRYFSDHFGTLLPMDRTANIVEIGCGQGENLVALRTLGYKNFVGVDSSAAQLARARSRFALAKDLEHANALDWLADRPSTFDVILAIDVLEHLELTDLLAIGQLCKAALKPTGRLIVQVPNGVSPLNPIRDGDITHLRAFTAASLEQFFECSGLKSISLLDTPPRAHSLAGAARRLLWKGAVQPALKLLSLTVHGPTPGPKLFTANMIGVAENSERHL